MQLQWLRLSGGLNDNNFDFEMLVEEGSSLKAALSAGMFEPEVSWALLRLLRKGDVFVDVGANVGFFTLMASQCVGPSGHVVAFEPSPNALAWLDENLARNKCENVTVIRQPAAARAGNKVRFWFHPFSSMGDALYDPAEILQGYGPGNSVEMTVTTVDDELARLALNGRLAAIKIDVEGAELEVLRGAANTLDVKRPAVFAEWHPRGLARMGATLAEMRDFMIQRDFETWWPQKNGSLPILVPYNTDIKLPEEVLPSNPVINLMFTAIGVVGDMYPAMQFGSMPSGGK